MRSASTPHDEVLYHHKPVQIGRFWVAVGEPGFSDTGAIENHILVIPTWAIEISYPDHDPVVADPTKVMLYNRGCEYRRRSLNPNGDLAYWIAFEDETLAANIGAAPGTPFTRRSAPLPRDAFLVARALVAVLRNGVCPEPLQVEDCAWWLLSRCLDAPHAAPRSSERQRRAIAAAEAFIALQYRERISLNDIAAVAHLSPFHLSRLFHRITGMRLHQRLTALRVRDAVPDVMDGDRTLTDIATSLGFSSPSHFSNCFRATFGMPPSRLRERAAQSVLRRQAGVTI